MNRIAHLSDLHFTSWDWKLSQFFSKRWLGNLNFLFGRRHLFVHDRLQSLPAFFQSQNVSTVLITGDLSTTSAPAEFSAARRFVTDLEKQGLTVLCIPGNHDHYTKAAYKNRFFYDYFSSNWETGPYNLKQHGVTVKKIENGWWIVGLDTALATSWFYSTGYFNPQTEEALKAILHQIPPTDQIMLINHFPFFQHESPRKQLVRGSELKKVIEQFPQIKIYCHGHTHRQCQAHLKASGLPLILDPGSTTYRTLGGLHLIDLSQESASVQLYEWNLDRWAPSREATYDLV